MYNTGYCCNVKVRRQYYIYTLYPVLRIMLQLTVLTKHNKTNISIKSFCLVFDGSCHYISSKISPNLLIMNSIKKLHAKTSGNLT